MPRRFAVGTTKGSESWGGDRRSDTPTCPETAPCNSTTRIPFVLSVGVGIIWASARSAAAVSIYACDHQG